MCKRGFNMNFSSIEKVNGAFNHTISNIKYTNLENYHKLIPEFDLTTICDFDDNL